MQCRPGDLAMYVGDYWPELRGCRIVRVLSERPHIEPAWFVEPPFPPLPGTDPNSVLDRALRPIRDQPGEDEILRIAGKPQETVRDMETTQ